MQQGYRDCALAGCIKLQGILRANSERVAERGPFRVTSSARGIEINILFEATIDPDTGYHPYQLPG
jgi:hypothetical protein